MDAADGKPAAGPQTRRLAPWPAAADKLFLVYSCQQREDNCLGPAAKLFLVYNCLGPADSNPGFLWVKGRRPGLSL
jgi:hypothetical protein